MTQVTTGGYSRAVKAVGIKQLKSELSHYVRLVKAGETIFVTERDEVVAEIRPARRQPMPANNLEEILDSLAQAGEVTRAGTSKGEWSWKPRGQGLPSGTAQSLLDDIREDR